MRERSMSNNGHPPANARAASDPAPETARAGRCGARPLLAPPLAVFVEVVVDTTAYEQSHLPGAVGWNWTSQLADGIRRDIASPEDFSKLLSESGSGPDTTHR